MSPVPPACCCCCCCCCSRHSCTSCRPEKKQLKWCIKVHLFPEETRWLYCVECSQYSIRLVAVCYLCTSCLLPAFDNAWCHVPATEWCQRYLLCYLFSISNLVCFSSISVERQHSGVPGLPNIGHRTLPIIWKVRFLYAAYIPVEWFWIDSNGKNGN